MKSRAIRAISIGMIMIFVIMWPLYVFILSNNKEEDENLTTEEWRGIIEIWDFPRLNAQTGNRYQWIINKIKIFERQNPGVFIELKGLDWEKGAARLEESIRVGNLPDIAPVGADYIVSNSEVLESLDSYFSKTEKDEFKHQAINAVTYNDKMYAVPFLMTTYVMYLNLDLFRQRGVEPPIDGNWTYEEFVEKMIKLTYDSDNNGKIDRYGFTSFIKPNYYNLWGIILSDGAQIIDAEENKYRLYGDSALSGLNKVLDLKFKYKVTPDNFGEMNENTAWDMFYNQKEVAVYPTGSWAVGVLNKLRDNGEGFEFAVANYPIGESRLPISFNNGVSSYGVFKQEDKGKADMCVKFLKFLTQDKYQQELEQLGVFPVKKNIKDIYINDSKMKKIEDVLSYTQGIPKHELWNEIDTIVQTQIKLAVEGKISSEEALENARSKVIELEPSLR